MDRQTQQAVRRAARADTVARQRADTAREGLVHELKAARAEGVTVRELAEVVGMSHQRIVQLTETPKGKAQK